MSYYQTDSPSYDRFLERLKEFQSSLKKEWILNELRLMQESKRSPSSLERMADAHWNYIESVLQVHGESEEVIEKCGHHYRTAFIHGWKHADEARKNGEELYRDE